MLYYCSLGYPDFRLVYLQSYDSKASSMNLIHGMFVCVCWWKIICRKIIFSQNKILNLRFVYLNRFNYRATAYMVQHGFYDFLNWFDERAWYPLGRIVGGTVYPGLMITSGGIHWLLHMLNIPVHIRDICVFLAPVFR